MDRLCSERSPVAASFGWVRRMFDDSIDVQAVVDVEVIPSQSTECDESELSLPGRAVSLRRSRRGSRKKSSLFTS